MTVSEHSLSPKLTEETLATLVNAFYARVQADALLSTVFNTAVPDGHWPAHLERMAAFWSSIMLTSGRYHGNPMLAHLKHGNAITPAMFARWLELWEQTASEQLAPDPADAILAKAQRMARNLQFGLFQHAA